MNVKILLSPEIYEKLFSIQSTYNLGVAIASLAIIVAFIEIISIKNDLKIKIYSELKKVALILAFLSVLLSGIAEFIPKSFTLNIIASLLMVISIGIYIWLIAPLKRIGNNKIKKIKSVLNGFLPNKYAHDNNKIIENIISIFNDLLKLSLGNKDVSDLFSRYFTSKIFLEYFSKSGYIFDKTLNFLIDNNKQKDVEYFFEQLLLKSLDNQDSYLNIFINEDIYPHTIDSFDLALLDNRKIIPILQILQRIKFDLRYKLTVEGQLSFLKIVNRYFHLIDNFNECNKWTENQKRCEIKYQLNVELVKLFFESIEDIFKSVYSYSSAEKKQLLDTLSSVGILHSYNYCIDFNDKDKEIRKRAGKFLYNIFKEMLISYNFYDKDKEIDNKHYINLIYKDVTHHGEDKIAQSMFIEKMKDKIIRDKYSPNIKGWYPAMILIYWQLFGFSIFSKNTAMNESREIHIEILSELSESFSKLYSGHIRHFYNKEILNDKKDYYVKKGRKILDDFLLSHMEYNYEENSLSYYFEFGKSPDGAKIYLNDVKKNKKIEIVKI